jgi:hypothetical protein
MKLYEKLKQFKWVVDPLRSTKRAVYVTGSARSGTTWVAELLCQAQRARLLFEPLHHKGTLAGMPHFVVPGAAPVAASSGLNKALSGSLNTWQVNMFQNSGLFSRRVVKDIRPGVLPALRHQHPGLPVVLVLRHPLEVACSRAELEERPGNWWDTDNAIKELQDHSKRQPPLLGELARRALHAISQADDPLAEHLAIWCVENSLALHGGPDPCTATVRYEDLVTDPGNGFEPINCLLNLHLPNGAATATASSTTFRQPGQVGKLGKWRQHLDEGRASRLLDMTREFGLDDIYGLDHSLDRGAPRRSLNA